MHPRAVATLAMLCTVVLGGCPATGGSAARVENRPPREAPDSPAQRVPPTVRVTLSKVTSANPVRVRIAGGWTLVSLGGQVILRNGQGLDGPLDVARGARLGDRDLPRGGALLRPAVDGDLRVGDRRYPGVLRVWPVVDGSHRAAIETDVESYLEGVVPGEVPATFPREAQRAQAIVARTYALSRPGATLAGPIRLSDSGGQDQEYHGYAPVAAHARIARDAVRSTRGMVLRERGSLVRAWYHSTCGGHTAPGHTVFDELADPSSAALAGVPCHWCTTSRYYRWEGHLAADDVVRAAGLTGSLRTLSVAERDPGGRAVSLRVVSSGGARTVHAAAFRLRVGPGRLRSVFLDEITPRGDSVHIRGRGWGHGVGLCQVGAKGLAEQGLRGEDVVRAYYPGADLLPIW
jgi:stage II sporulation protein D